MQLSEKLRGHFGFSSWSPSHWIGDGVNGSWLCQETGLATRKKSEETDTARQELGKGQRVFHVGEEGMGTALWSLQL